MEDEIWKTIEEFPNYKVSNYGNILSTNYRNTGVEKQMNININNDYPQINFINGNVKKSIKIHRLVALYFVDNINNYKIVNHIDGDKTNNYYKNLEWCSYSHNIKHAHASGLNNISELNKSIIKEKISRKVIDVITNIEYNSIKEAAKALNIERRTLNDYLLGKRKNKTNLKYK